MASESEQKKNLTEQIFDYIVFFRRKGYLISADFPERILTAVSLLGLKNPSFEDLEGILRTMTVQTAEQNARFFYDFDDFVRRHVWTDKLPDVRERMKIYETYDSQKQPLKNRKKKLENELKRLREELSVSENGILKLDEKTVQSLLKDREKTGGDFAKLFGTIEDPVMRETIENLYDLPTISTDQIRSLVLTLMRRCVLYKNAEQMMKHLKKILDARTKVMGSEDFESPTNLRLKINALETDLENINNVLSKLEQTHKYAENDRLAIKWQSQTHREQFQPGGSVWQLCAPERNLPQFFDKPFSSLTSAEKDQIRQYLYENAREFRTRIARSIRTGQRRRIDIAETCKKACSSGGVPMRISYQKPVRSRANMVLFLDISGSCREASELMSYFLYIIRDMFPGGCRTYVFVNQLYDVTGYLDNPNPEAAVESILTDIPTKGVYSDYSEPLRDFHENHFSEINRDTLLFFIGDARNNKNPTGEEHLKEICRKCRKAFWLETDRKEKWDTGDSIIGVYRPYLRAVTEVLTAGDLINSMDMIRGMSSMQS